MTGFVIDGEARPMSVKALAAYATFSPDGIVAQKLPAARGFVPGTHTPSHPLIPALPGFPFFVWWERGTSLVYERR